MVLENDNPQARIQTICLMVLAAAAVTYMVYWLRPVLVPAVVAVFVVSGVSPVLNMLERRLGVTRIVAAGLSFLAGVVVLAFFGFAIWVSMLELSRNREAYLRRVQELVREVDERIPLNLPIRDAKETKRESGSADSHSTEQTTQLIDSFVRQGISIISQALISLVSTTVVVLIFVFFLLIGTPTMDDARPSVREIDRQIRSYLSLKTVISIFTGAAFGLALWLFGVPMAFTFGVLAFLLNFVPNVGPIVASLLPIPLILLDPTGSIGWMMAVIAVTSTIQLVSGNIIEPKVMGDSSDLHPVTVLLALMFWGMMWGVIGMFLATPITAALKIMLERIDQTRPIADMMSGRWIEDRERGHAVS